VNGLYAMGRGQKVSGDSDDIEFILPTGLPKNHPVHVQLRLDRQSIVTVIIEVDGSPLRHEQVLKRGWSMSRSRPS